MAGTPEDTIPAAPSAAHEEVEETKGQLEELAEREARPHQPGELEESSDPKEPSAEGEDVAAGKQAESEENTGEDENPPLPDEPVPTQNEWQAIWAPTHNAYYFYNSRTGETTWVNPLEPESSASGSTSAQPQPETPPQPESKPDEPKPDEQEEAPRDLSYLNGIDPDLAYLDPALAVPPKGAKGPVPTFAARFGARSGAFTAMDARRPEHLSEAARAARMSSVYFDTEAWEREIAERDAKAKAEAEAGVGDKRKRLTKADIERFKEQKKAKKALRNAWLRE